MADSACGGFLLWLLDAGLAGTEFAPRIIGERLIIGGAVSAGGVDFKLVINGFKPKEPRNW